MIAPHPHPQWWRLVAVYAAAVGSFVFGLTLLVTLGIALRTDDKPVPWEGFFALIGLFAVLAAVVVPVLAIAAGRLWPERSEPVGTWGGTEFRAYLPQTPLDWVAFVAATYITAGCCVIAAMLAFVVLYMGVAGQCPACGEPVSPLSRWCPRCGASRQG